MGEASDIRSATHLTAQARFALVAAIVLAVLLFAFVVRPAVERGGWGELALVAGAFAVILLLERWLRAR